MLEYSSVKYCPNKCSQTGRERKLLCLDLIISLVQAINLSFLILPVSNRFKALLNNEYLTKKKLKLENSSNPLKYSLTIGWLESS